MSEESPEPSGGAGEQGAGQRGIGGPAAPPRRSAPPRAAPPRRPGAPPSPGAPPRPAAHRARRLPRPGPRTSFTYLLFKNPRYLADKMLAYLV